MPTGILRRALPRSPLDIHPLARLHPDGRIELLQPAFPPLGRVRLVLWRPGEDPAFGVEDGRVEPGWRWSGAARDAWVVWWVAVGDPTLPS